MRSKYVWLVCVFSCLCAGSFLEAAKTPKPAPVPLTTYSCTEYTISLPSVWKKLTDPSDNGVRQFWGIQQSADKLSGLIMVWKWQNDQQIWANWDAFLQKNFAGMIVAKGKTKVAAQSARWFVVEKSNPNSSKSRAIFVFIQDPRNKGLGFCFYCSSEIATFPVMRAGFEKSLKTVKLLK